MGRSPVSEKVPRKVTITSQTDVFFQATDEQLAQAQTLLGQREFRDMVSGETARLVLSLCNERFKHIGVKID